MAHQADTRINEALYNSQDDGIIVMRGLREYQVWTHCTNAAGAFLAPTQFGETYKSRHAAAEDFRKCGGQVLRSRMHITKVA